MASGTAARWSALRPVHGTGKDRPRRDLSGDRPCLQSGRAGAVEHSAWRHRRRGRDQLIGSVQALSPASPVSAMSAEMRQTTDRCSIQLPPTKSHPSSTTSCSPIWACLHPARASRLGWNRLHPGSISSTFKPAMSGSRPRHPDRRCRLPGRPDCPAGARRDVPPPRSATASFAGVDAVFAIVGGGGLACRPALRLWRRPWPHRRPRYRCRQGISARKPCRCRSSRGRPRGAPPVSPRPLIAQAESGVGYRRRSCSFITWWPEGQLRSGLACRTGIGASRAPTCRTALRVAAGRFHLGRALPAWRAGALGVRRTGPMSAPRSHRGLVLLTRVEHRSPDPARPRNHHGRYTNASTGEARRRPAVR